ncbi:MAG: hypothetical protein LBV04_10015 [Deferribacteraceae bacterium]|jgi:hypothetical protein|nr:hypothetical protein [Deferribacteraceae bacterium]
MFKKFLILLAMLSFALVGCGDADETDAKFILTTNVSGKVVKEDKFKSTSTDIQDILGIMHNSGSSNIANFSDKQKTSIRVSCRVGNNELEFAIRLDGFDEKWYQAGSADDIDGKKLETAMIDALIDWVKKQYDSMPAGGEWEYKTEERTITIDDIHGH